MCGIAGIYHFSPDIPVDPAVLKQMADRLAHRGPDQEGFHTSQNVGLTARRLKIIDLSAAASQPMHDEKSRYFLIYNGEIYNFKDLRKQLQSTYQFFSHSDTEVLLRMFQEFGPDAWKHLNGMFAIAIWDSTSGELFLARDHAGIKPLYYYLDSNRFCFASEIPALIPSGIPRDLDLKSISFYLQLGYFPGHFTPYKNVYKLLPGHGIKVNSQGAAISKFWDIRKVKSSSTRSLNPEVLLEDYLSTSVSQQMISDVPIGAFLSGGIDSSLIVSFMSRFSSEIKTFTVGFPGMGYYDERPFAEKIARHFHTAHHEFSVDDRLEDLLPAVSSAFGEPFADSSAIPTYCLAKRTKEYVTVALSGTGGDEIFGGYRKYMAAHWTGMYLRLPESVRSGIRKSAGFLPSSRRSLWEERSLLLKRFLTLDSTTREGIQFNLLFQPDELNELLDSEPVLSVDFKPVDGTVAENMMLFDFENYLPEDLLVKEDRTTMAFGLEARVPYLDRPLIEFMASLPIRYKVSATQTKRLFKKIAARHLPEWVLKRPKHGFGAPVSEWLQSDLKTLATEVLSSPSRLIHSSLIRKKWKEHQDGVVDHSRQLWPVLMLELWYRNR